MNNVQISHLLTSHNLTKHLFKGVFAADTLPKTCSNKPSAYIVNFDKQKDPGTHWVAIYMPRKGISEYFDSYGFKPHLKSILLMIGKIYKYNTLFLQHPFSTVCGQYAIYFILQRAYGYDFEQLMKVFSHNSLENDAYVNSYIET
jgi:hypothetical protein